MQNYSPGKGETLPSQDGDRKRKSDTINSDATSNAKAIVELYWSESPHNLNAMDTGGSKLQNKPAHSSSLIWLYVGRETVIEAFSFLIDST